MGLKVLLVLACAVAPYALAGPWLPYGPANGGYAVSTHPTIAGRAMITASSEERWTFFTPDGLNWRGNPTSVLFYDRVHLSGSVAWAAFNGIRLYRSPDQGRTWVSVAVPAGAGVVIAGVNPANADEIVLASGGTIAHSTDAGTTWTTQSAPQPISTAVIDWSTRRLYAGAVSGALMRRPLDAPGAWATTPSSVSTIAARHGVVMYASRNHPFPTRVSLFRSVDHGATFAKVADAHADDGQFHDVAFASDPARVYAMDDQYVMRSDDGGATWTDGASVSGLFTPPVSFTPRIAIDASAHDKVYLATSRGIHASGDGGATIGLLERASGAPGRSRSVAFDAVDPMKQWMVGGHLSGAEPLLESTIDGGATWSVAATDESVVASSLDRPNTLFGFRFDALRVSTDGGSTWTTAFQPFPDTGYAMKALAQGGQPAIVAVAGGEPPFAPHALHVSLDGGVTFAARATPPMAIHQLAISPSTSGTLYASSWPAAPGAPNFWRSKDGATTWQPAGAFASLIPGRWFNEVFAIAIDPRDPDRVYVGLVHPHALLRSDDGGASWTRKTVGLGAGAVTSIVIDPDQPVRSTRRCTCRASSEARTAARAGRRSTPASATMPCVKSCSTGTGPAPSTQRPTPGSTASTWRRDFLAAGGARSSSTTPDTTTTS